MNEGKSILILVEIINKEIHKVSYELLWKAGEISRENEAPVYCLVLGEKGLALEELNYRGANKVFYMKDNCFANHEEYLFKENIIKFVQAHKPAAILTGATNFGRSLAPRIAAGLRTGLTADCIDLKVGNDGHFIQIRPAFSDHILAHIKTMTLPQMATIRYKEFEEAPHDRTRPVDIEVISPYTTVCEKTSLLDVFQEDNFDISNAEVVVAGGRGIRKKEDLQMLRELSCLLHGELGVSRALVDAGMAGSARQVGYSGNRVKPRLYIACGISGAPQHLAGMKEAQVIVAVNSDPSAPIFSICDYGYVGDLYEIVPRLIEDVKKWEEAR